MIRSRSQFIVWVTLSYIGLALAWVFLSDRLLAALVDVQSLVWLSTAKGFFFVAVSAALFFLALQSVPAATASEQGSPWDALVLSAISGRRARWLIYGLAILLPLLTLAIRQGMSVSPEHRPMLILFVFPSILCALLGGWGPGVLATLTSTGCVLSLFGSRTWEQIPSHDMFNLCMLVFNGLAVSLLGEMLRGSLRRSQTQAQLLDAVVSGTSDGIFVKDMQGRYLMANEAVAHFVGKPVSEIVGQDDRALFPEPTASEVMLRDTQVMAGGQIQLVEEPVLSLDGRQLVFQVTKGPLLDARQRVLGLFGIARDITERKQAEAALLERDTLLRDREQQLARVLEGSDLGFWDWNLQTNEFVVSPRWETMLGYEPGDIDVRVDQWSRLVHPEDLALAHESIERHLAGMTPSHELEMRVRTKLGDWRWVLTRGRIVSRSEDGRPLIMAGTHADIHERKTMELVQREASTMFASSYEGIMVVNPQMRIIRVNPAFTRITGYEADEVLGQSPAILSSGQHGAEFYAGIWTALKRDDFWRGEIINCRKSGESFTELISIAAVRDARGELQHYVGVFSDISQIKAHAAEMDRIAHYDPLTGLPNRRLLADRLGQGIAHAKSRGRMLAVCFLDLDSFKAVNDAHGHDCGDGLLIGVSDNLKQTLRADDTLARIGGDEFVLLLTNLGSHQECTRVLDRVLQAANLPVQVGDISLRLSASIGVATYPEDDADADTLLRHADQAMYMAKEAGKNRYLLFDPESDRRAQEHRKVLQSLQQALERQEFVLHYQPKVDLVSGEIVGVEALLRWQPEGQPLVAPGDFLPHVAGSELEQPLGHWVLASALQQAQQWQREGLRLTVSINVSANHLLRPGFCQDLQAALQRCPEVEPARIELEVLESAAIADMAQAVQVMNDCRALGVRFALDDFGTGYSSLTYLRKLPVDILKIDQSFVRDMLVDAEDLGIVEGVIRLARAFNRDVIAEGVETLEHGTTLARMGCRLVQGFGIARPMPAADIRAWADGWKIDQPWLRLPHGNLPLQVR